MPEWELPGDPAAAGDYQRTAAEAIKKMEIFASEQISIALHVLR